MKPLTKEQLRDNAAAILAFADGKPIQFDASSYDATTPRWVDCQDIGHIHDICHRPKPQPVSRPWSTPEDVPLHCWLRSAPLSDQSWLVNGVLNAGVYSAGGMKNWNELRDYEYSTDRKTWKPCTVEDAP